MGGFCFVFLSLQLSEISDIHLDKLEFAKVCEMLPPKPCSLLGCFLTEVPCVCCLQGRGTFPCDISVLEIHQDLDWNPKVSALNMWPLYICDDGAIVFYR